MAFRLAFAVSVAFAFVGCGEVATPPCASTCAGCCDSANTCRTSSPSSCGAAGSRCVACLLNETCSLGTCTSTNSGGGAGGGGSTGGGGGATGGGGGTATGGGGAQDAGACAGTLISCGSSCIDHLADPLNCGSCGQICGQGQVCNRGTCSTLPVDCTGVGCAPGYFCEPSTRACVAGCRLPTDCPMGSACVSGACQCASDQHACGQRCVESNSVASCIDACTSCPTRAGADTQCLAFGCVSICRPGQLECGGDCIPCAAPANATPSCNAGACDFTCLAGYHRCGAACAPDNSPTSCGSTCTVCPATANSTATCSGSTCGYTCNAGFHRCGTACLPDDSVNSCGSSCSPCTGRPNATSTCFQAPSFPFACGFNCNAGYRLCSSGACVAVGSRCPCSDVTLDCPTTDGGVELCYLDVSVTPARGFCGPRGTTPVGSSCGTWNACSFNLYGGYCGATGTCKLFCPLGLGAGPCPGSCSAPLFSSPDVPAGLGVCDCGRPIRER